MDTKYTDFVLPQIPRMSDSPVSSTPSTPGEDSTSRGHRRTDSITIEGEDYFMSVARFADSSSKSMPGTPRSLVSRNISFSPRIQFHDTWPSGEYDRRGEIATCNRLTPMLAQQIKEELNTFKMVRFSWTSHQIISANLIDRRWKSMRNLNSIRISSETSKPWKSRSWPDTHTNHECSELRLFLSQDTSSELRT